MQRLKNSKLEIDFSNDGGRPVISGLLNLLTGELTRFESHDFHIVSEVNGHPVLFREVSSVEALHGSDAQVSFQLQLNHGTHRLHVTMRYELVDSTLQCKCIIRNGGGEALLLKDLILFEAAADRELIGKKADIDPTSGDAGTQNRRVPEVVDAHPVFLGDQAFCGVDWPVAENEIRGERIRCLQFCGDVLEAGAEFHSRTFTIGVSEQGKVAEAFMRHINRIRGRKTRRASLYFDWLTHASEGLAEHELQKIVDYFARLKAEYGIGFDIFSVDDGIVETRWALTFDQYRLQHDSLYPNGLKPITEQLKALGTEFGVWIGPDGFGKTEEEAGLRIQDVVTMVKDWNVGLFKMDVCVSYPLTLDRYHNEKYMRNLERLVHACHEANPEIIIINHRISSSPYILGMLDSTLWNGSETYPDTFMLNSDKPRLFTRYASLGRGEPTYYGGYSELLEDHGICFNGEHQGWAEEFVVQAFGRALMLSPEVYGTVFLLPDEEYPELARLLNLAEEKKQLLSNTAYMQETGDFLHSDGEKALLCLINDSWQTSIRTIRPAEALAMDSDAKTYAVQRHFPVVPGETDTVYVQRDQSFEVRLKPFGVALVEIAPAADGQAELNLQPQPILTLPADVMELASQVIGAFTPAALTPQAVGCAERIKFAINSDPLEVQALRELSPSRMEESNDCRRNFLDKVRRQSYGVSSNAWDGDPATAWGDLSFIKQMQNHVWRLDLGEPAIISRIELDLADFRTASEGTNQFAGPVEIEASIDGIEWHCTTASLYWTRQPASRQFVSKLIADFSWLSSEIRYVRMHLNNALVRDIRIGRFDGHQRLTYLQRDGWFGNNLLTAREPVGLYTASFTVNQVKEGQYFAMVAELPSDVKAPLKQEIAVGWIQDGNEGTVWPVTKASPAYPFHGWECNTMARAGSGWVFRLPLSKAMEGKTLTANLAWYGPSISKDGDLSHIGPAITGHIVHG